jgi:hypothetical protein
MAYRFTAISSQYLSAGASVTAGSPVTIAYWVRPTDTLGGNFMHVSVGDSGSTHRIQMYRAGGANFNIDSIATSAAGFLISSAFSAGTWAHCACAFASNTSRTPYINGSASSTNTTNIGTQNAFNETLIAARRNVTAGVFGNDTIAEVGIWNAALTAAEIASLAKGMTCDKVRPQSLVFYAPLVRDLIDARGGLSITNNNGATVANHPRVYA